MGEASRSPRRSQYEEALLAVLLAWCVASIMDSDRRVLFYWLVTIFATAVAATGILGLVVSARWRQSERRWVSVVAAVLLATALWLSVLGAPRAGE
jgi:uncharacterized membrane protein HdeD (DUF308 family)